MFWPRSERKSKMNKAIIAFVPVLHEGYRRFFEKNRQEADLYILGPQFIKEWPHLAKEIRALGPSLIKRALEAWGIFKQVFILEPAQLPRMKKTARQIIMPDEDIMRDLAQKYFPGKKIKFDAIFLRWDKHNTIKENPVQPDAKISRKKFDREMMKLVDKEAEKSSDWWRRIGVAVVKDKKVIFTCYNHHVPSQHSPYVNGDPRNNFKKGVNLELSTSFHSEAAAIAYAAKHGISLEGAEIYVTTFPCPPCAKLVAYSGIKKLYYSIGYGVLDGESILKANGVEIIQVK